MTRPLSTTEVLECILSSCNRLTDTIGIDVEASPAWFPKEDGDPDEGEAQAGIYFDGKHYTISLEKIS